MPLDLSKIPDAENKSGINLEGIPSAHMDSLKGYYRQAQKPSDEYIRVDKLSKATGLPKPTVENNIAQAEIQAKEPDWDTVSPKLQGILSNDIELFKVAKDDVEHIGAIERSVKAFGAGAAQATLGLAKSVQETPEAAARGAEYLSQSLEQLTGLPRMFDPLRAVQYSAEYFARGKIPGTGIQTGGMTDIADRIGEAQDILSQESETFSRINEKGAQADAALRSALFGTKEDETAPDIVDMLTDPEAWAGFIGQAAPSLYTAYKSGGSIPFIAWMEGMQSADSAIDFEKRTGQKISPQQFSQAVAEAAVVNAVLEKYGLDKVFGEPAGNLLSDVIKRTLAEGGTEALQQFNSNVAAYITYDPNQDLTEGVLGSAMGGAGTGGVAGGVSSMAKRISNRTNANEIAQQRSANMAMAIDSAKKSKLREGDKESFANVMNQLLTDEAEDVYLSSEDASQFFQDNPEAAQEVSAKLPDVVKSIQEAAESGGDVVIPAKDYITYFADYHDKLADKIRIGADGVSLNEAEQWKAADTEQFKKEADEILKERTSEDSANKVYQSIKDQIVATGRFTGDVADKYAALHKAVATSLADRLGITPEEVYSKYGLGVRVPPPAAEPSPPPGEVAVAGGTQFEQPLKPSDISSKLGIEARELTDEEYQDAIKLFSKLSTSRTALQTEGRDGKTVAETQPEKTWLSKTAIVNESGKPAVVYRGANRYLQQSDFSTENLGYNTGFNASGLGVWFTSSSDEAAGYGENVEPFHLDIRNPKVFSIGSEDDIPDFDSINAAVDYRKFLQQQGYDGVVIDLRDIGEGFHAVAFDSTQAIRPESSFYQEYDYRIQHTAPVKDGANTADDTSDIYPDDVYDSSVSWNYYGHGGSKEQIAIDKRSAQIVSKLKGEPDKEVTIYRAVPKGVNDINPGDWVTINKDYADTHGISQFGEGEYDVIQKIVTAKEIATDGNSIHEWGYSPEGYEFEQKKRGAITIPLDITKGTSVITLFEDADLSTFIHESGHFFFEVMTDIANQDDGPQQIKDDVQTLFDWYGIKNISKWNSMDTESRRAHHEQFARGFEAYLFEGKAPSVELKTLFQRFRAWMVSIYKSIRGLDVELTDEVRGVMDRLVATDDQIKVAEAANNYRPLFDSMEQARMSKSEYDAYVAANDVATDSAIEYLEQRSMKDMQWLSRAKSKKIKALQRDAATKRKAVKTEVTEQLSNEPIYQASKFFKTGETFGVDGEEIKVTQGFKLHKAEVLELFPPEELASVDLSKLKGMLSVNDGMNIDMAGQMFGFENGDQLVKAILNAPVLKDAIEDRTDEVMLERYGDISSPEALEAAANEAIHNDARAKFIATEMRALSRQLGSKSEIIRAAKDYAENKISQKTLKEAVKSAQYRSAEARAARDAETAIKKDDIEKAALHKKAQILNFYMGKSADSATVEVDKILNYLKKFGKSSVRKNLRGDMVNQLDALLAKFDLRKAPPKDVETKSLSEFVKDESDRLDAAVPDLDPIASDENYRKHYKDLTLDEFRGLRDTVKQLEHMARRENKMYIERRNMGFEQEKGAILSELSAAHPEAFDNEGLPKPYRKDRDPLLKDYRNRFRSKFDAEFLNVENLLDVMTLGKGKQVFDSLFNRLSEAQDQQTVMMKDLAKFLDPYTKAYSVKERLGFSMASSRVFVPEVGEYFTRDKRVAVALFYGSLDGRQRLMDGNSYTDSQVKAIIRTLSPKDLDFIDALWRMSDEKIWPELKALDERTKGVAAKKIDPAPYVINGREMRGGYVPLVYDGDLSTRSYDLNTDNAINELRGGTTTQATTRQSASKQRLREVKRPLDLSVSAISYKINETVHDITHREAVTDTYRLMKSTRISNAIRSIAGPAVYKAMLEKVRETAVSPVVPRGVTEKALWYLRRNTMINMMGASFNTFAINVLGMSPSIRRVGPVRFARAVQKLASKDAVKRYKWLLEKSPYMRSRLEGFDRDLNTEVNRFTGKAGVMPSLSLWFAGLSVMDRMITIPTWMAAYEQSMEESGNDETMSVQYADRIIRQTQGSGRIIDLAKVSGGVGTAGEFKRIITMYYNFFSSQLGMMVRSKRLAEKEWSEGRRAKAAMEFTLTTLAVIVIPSTLEAIARGNCGDDPDAEDYMHCTVRSSALFWSSMFPLVRDMVPFAWHQFDPDTPAFGVRLSPVESAMETMAKTPKSTADIFMGEATESDVRTVLRGLGYTFGLPGFQASRSLEGWQAFMDGDTDNPAVVLTGAPR